MSDPLFGLEKDHRIRGDGEVVLLTTVHDVAMLGLVRGLLEDADIPYLVHERATGSAMRIMTGFSLFGTDIFVPASALETARGLIAGFAQDTAANAADAADAADAAQEKESE